jgi:drug/metabolite transporter (DMT)-like permease
MVPVALTRVERQIFIGLLIPLVFASVVAVNGLSGMGTQPVGKNMLGVILAIAGGVAMSVSTMQCRRLNDAGVRPGVLFSLRYPLTTLAAGILALMSPARMSDTPPWISAIMAIAVLVIVVPSYINQIAISLASPLTVRVVMASAPVIIFLLQTIEGRLSPSLYSLAAAMLYALLAILAALARRRAILTTKINRTNRDLDPSLLRQPLSADHDRGDNQLERSDVIPVSDADRDGDAAKIASGSNWRRNYPL